MWHGHAEVRWLFGLTRWYAERAHLPVSLAPLFTMLSWQTTVWVVAFDGLPYAVSRRQCDGLDPDRGYIGCRDLHQFRAEATVCRKYRHAARVPAERRYVRIVIAVVFVPLHKRTTAAGCQLTETIQFGG